MSGEIGFVPGSQTATIDEDSVSPTAVLKVQRTKASFGEVQVCSIKHETPCLNTFPNSEKRVENTRCFEMWSNTVFTITAEIHARSLVNFYRQYVDRHMNLKFMRRVSARERAIRPFVIVKNKLMSVFNESVLLCY